MYKKNNGSTEQEILQNQFSAYVKKAVHNRRIQFLTEKSRKFRFETPLFDLDYLLFDTTDIIQEITDHETVRQALRSIKENERRIVLERIIEEKSFGQLSDELGMSYKTVASLYYRAILTYCKLNDMCNAEAYCWSLRTTHKNQLQKKYSTIYRVCQEFRNYI